MDPKDVWRRVKLGMGTQVILSVGKIFGVEGDLEVYYNNQDRGEEGVISSPECPFRQKFLNQLSGFSVV